MKKAAALSFILMLITSFASAQESSSTKFKIYYSFNKTVFNTMFDMENQNYAAFEYDLNAFSLGELSLAVNIRNDARWAQEFEIMPLSFHKTDFKYTQITRTFEINETKSENFSMWRSRLR
ncbi:MAG: hypothetical protein ACOCWK_01545, partial [Tangfeifania sp.]